ncbi:MAG: VWA domain-containing protein [Planctomycetota bacterium]|nr:MAG: VWA domain-containing protein [Planctomycetota bacterium]
MIALERPEALLLALPLGWAVWRWGLGGGRAGVRVLRALLLAVLVLLLAGPRWQRGAPGRDLILLIDRSRSAGTAHEQRLAEIAALAERARGPHDRIGMVVFGREARVELSPRSDFAYHPPRQSPDPDATDLGAAIRAGLSLIPEGRPGSLVLVSDGEANAGEAEPAALLARERGVRIDAFVLRRPGAADLWIEEVAAPAEVAAGEPFLVPLWVHADTAHPAARIRVLREQTVIAEGEQALLPGRNRIVFRDRLPEPGLYRYRVEVVGIEDRIPENNRAETAVLAVGAPRLLCITPGGRQDRLTRSLALAGLQVQCLPAERAPLSLERLEGYRAVVLENVPAGDLAPGGLQALRRYVEELGGGLLMTGGRASFGVGGYRRSPLEEVLPVSLEVRREQRRFSAAMALVLDRSGSMGADAGGGLTKMDLANRGAVEAVLLLGPGDSVCVLAVDSEPHLVVPLEELTDRQAVIRRILGIASAGGGIYTATGVHAAAAQLAKATQQARHIVLFADAADAEEPGDLDRFVPQLRAAGITLSVIALGSATDSDAEFLRELARLGGGRIAFVEQAAELPRVFAEETIQALQASLITEPTAVQVLPPLAALGAGMPAEFPEIGGYNVAYPRPGAELGARTADEIGAPLVAFWQRGLGRVATLLCEADGELSGGLSRWPQYGRFMGTLVRWLLGPGLPAPLHASAVRRGEQVEVSVEAEPAAEALLSRLALELRAPDGSVQPLVADRQAAGRLAARFRLAQPGVHRVVVRAGEEHALVLPPLALPVPVELVPPADPRAGERMLRRLAELGGGQLEPPAAALFAGAAGGLESRPLWPQAALLALVLLLVEIAVRRLGLRLPAGAVRRALRRGAAVLAAGAASVGRAGRALRGLGRARPAEPVRPSAPAAPQPGEGAPPPVSGPPPAAPAPSPPELQELLARARRRAGRRY